MFLCLCILVLLFFSLYIFNFFLATHRKQQLASLDKIAAKEHERQQRWKKTQKEQKETLENSSSSRSSSNNHSGSSLSSNSITVNSVTPKAIPNSVKFGLSTPPVRESFDKQDEDLLSFGEDSDDDEEEEMQEGYTSGYRKKSDVMPFVTGNLDDASLRLAVKFAYRVDCVL